MMIFLNCYEKINEQLKNRSKKVNYSTNFFALLLKRLVKINIL